MRWRSDRLALVALLVLTAAACSGAAAQSPGTDPTSFIVRFRNGSVIQPAVLAEAVEIETKFGKFAIPAKEVLSIDFGFRLSQEDDKKLEQAMSDLSSDKFALRETATKTLMSLGRLAYPAVVEGLKGADLERAKRLQLILKDIQARNLPERLQMRRTDIVRTSDSTITGQIVSAGLRFRWDPVGEMKLQLWQLRELRSLAPGGELIASVDASKYGNNMSWMETDFAVMLGTRLQVKATGEINLDPTNMFNNPTSRGIKPDGTQGWNSGEGYLPGQLLGRIGTSGPTFVIGSRHSAVTKNEGKLFLRIVTLEHANKVRADGTYQVVISSEPE
jgi:hypothetical protein